MTVSRLTLFLSTFLLFIGFSACKKQNQSPQWDADELIPLVKSSVNIYHLSNYNELSSDSTGALRLQFNNSLFSLQLDSLISIPDTSLTERIDTLFLVHFIPGVLINLAQNKETKLTIGSSELVEATIQSGSIDISIKSTFSQPTILRYELTSATKNGNPLLISESIPPGSTSNPSSISTSYDLSNYDIDFRGIDSTSYNTLTSQISAMVAPSGDTLLTQFTDFIEITYSFNNIQPSYARGYFGNDTYSITESPQQFQFLANLTGGSIDIETINMNFTIKNGIGVDIRNQLHSISMQNTKTSQSTSLISPILNTPTNINRAQETGNSNSPVFPSLYRFNLNTSNSNIDALFEIIPNQITYGFDLEINPLGHVSSHNDFMYKNNGITIDLDMEMPISLALNKFTLSDTISFNIGEKTIEDKHLIINGFIHLYTDNWYPFSTTPQIYLLDENYTILDSILLKNSTINAGLLDNNNIVTTPTKSKISGEISPRKIDALYNAKYIKTDFTFSTINSPNFVTIYDYYKIDFNLVGDFNYVINTNK